LAVDFFLAVDFLLGGDFLAVDFLFRTPVVPICGRGFLVVIPREHTPCTK
jgi:hypothetical protein